MGRLLTVREAAEYLGLKRSTVSTYLCQGRLVATSHTPGGWSLFDTDYLDTVKNNGKPVSAPPVKHTVFYVRSSNGDEKLLERQCELLTSEYGEPGLVIMDKASGLNENRRGLNKLLRLAHDGEVTDVCITSRDRLTRFGYKYLVTMLGYDNVMIHVLDEDAGTVRQKTPESELLQDFMSLLASFSGKFYRMRGYAQQRAVLDKAQGEITRREEVKHHG